MRLVETHCRSGQEAEDTASILEDDVVCRALHVALCAVQLQIGWHAGVIGGDAAMAALEQEIQALTRGASRVS